MKIFLTGGSGFIGKHVIQKLNDGKNELLVLTRKEGEKGTATLHFLKGSLEKIKEWEKDLKKFMPEATIHLAWEGIPDYGALYSTRNLKYGLDLITLLGEVRCRTILATGSVWEYGKIQGKLSENMAVEPFNCFTASKNSLNWMGREIAKEYGMNFIWARLFYVYGPGQKKTSLISYLINCIKEGKKPEIRNPNAQNDFIYVEDVADAISKLILDYNSSGIFNIGSGKAINVETILNKLYNLLSVKKNYEVTEQTETDFLSASFADIAKIKAIGWTHKTNIDEGLKKTIESFN